jgi:hypothetical protein
MGYTEIIENRGRLAYPETHPNDIPKSTRNTRETQNERHNGETIRDIRGSSAHDDGLQSDCGNE